MEYIDGSDGSDVCAGYIHSRNYENANRFSAQCRDVSF